MLTTREKPRVIIQKNKSKHTDTARQQNKKDSRLRNKEQWIYKTIRKQNVNSPYILIITLNINRLNSPIERHRMLNRF